MRCATEEAMMSDPRIRTRGGRLQMPRSRGAMSGFLLILLGAWGALIPFVGPYLDFAFTPEQAWTWTDARGWLEVLPGAVAVAGGLLLLVSRNRATAMFGGWLAVIAGAWFVVGRAMAGPLGIGDAGTPVAVDRDEAGSPRARLLLRPWRVDRSSWAPWRWAAFRSAACVTSRLSRVQWRGRLRRSRSRRSPTR